MSLVQLDDVTSLEASLQRKELGQSLREEAEELSQDLGKFLIAGWKIVEPYEPFLGNWHIDAINAYLTAVTRGQIRKLQVWVPPGSMKSRAVSILWPAWEWTTMPHLRYFGASYDIDLATLLTVLWRKLVICDWFQAHWPIEFEKLDERYIRNSIGGSRLATAPGSRGSGHHGHRLLIDDPLNAKETESLTGTKLQEVIDWYDGTLPTRFANPKTGVEVIIMQRLHQSDLAEHALQHNPDSWEILCLPEEYEPSHPFAWRGDRVHPYVSALLAGTGLELGDPRKDKELLWPERIGPEENRERRERMGLHRAAGQLQQRPAAREGEILKRADWRYYPPELKDVALEDVEKLPPFRVVIQSWDTAFKELTTSDYVAGGVWGFLDGDKFLLRMFHARAGLNRVIEEITAYREWAVKRWPYARHYQVVEKAANGPDVLRKLKRTIPGMGTYTPTVDKVMRAEAASPDLESHNVFVPGQANGEMTDYDPLGTPEETQLLIEECAVFPNGTHDDLVDMFSQAINYGRTKNTRPSAGFSAIDVQMPRPTRIPT